MKRNWGPIRKMANEAALKLGHKLGPFQGSKKTPNVKTAACDICYGCCWIGNTALGVKAGGRVLNFQCGTKEAAGAL